MAKPGRPRKFQDEAEAVEDSIQEVQSEVSEEADESPVVDPAPIVMLESTSRGMNDFNFASNAPNLPAPGDDMHISSVYVYPSEEAKNTPEEINGHGKLDSSYNEAITNGWQPISTVSRNGFPVKITDDPSKEGVIAFWRKTRAFANATHRWEETGYWTDSTKGTNINFEARWWKDRYA